MSADKPRRYVVVGIPLTETEYRRLVSQRALQPVPTVASVIRERLGLRPTPFGWFTPPHVMLSEHQYWRPFREAADGD